MDEPRPLPDTDTALDRRLGTWMQRVALAFVLGAAVLGVLTVVG